MHTDDAPTHDEPGEDQSDILAELCAVGIDCTVELTDEMDVLNSHDDVDSDTD